MPKLVLSEQTILPLEKSSLRPTERVPENGVNHTILTPFSTREVDGWEFLQRLLAEDDARRRARQ